MAKAEIRKPRQARSIEKKNKIIQAGMKLFMEKGFYNTNTNEIAKEAGVSIGIIYHYFQDKKAIFLACMDQMTPKFDFNMVQQLHLSKDRKELEAFLSDIIDKNIQFHAMSKAGHEEFQAMRHLDPDVEQYMNQFEDKFLSEIADALPALGLSISHPREKLDIIFHMIDQYCDAVAINKRDKINYDDMKILLIETILDLLNLNIKPF
ncbi:MAG: TetR/AcrR family transcriptional regulator [Clostridium sp.]|uniref:TetR/AcrR family transcriptional regulator n=1 Tax=Clostridium sp. TaxID=1506 RepID=UPI0039ECCC76